MEENPKNKSPSQNIKNTSDKNKQSFDNKEKEEEIKIGNYLIKKTLGKGTFAKVKLAIHLPSKEKVAIKIIEKNRLKEEDDITRLKREFEMLTKFNHPNVISVTEIFENREAYFTVMEYCDGGELFNYIVVNRILSEEKAAFFYFQLVNGLEYIHSLGIVHRDLKPENLLLTSDYILKISDFGLSNYFNKNGDNLLETPCGSPCYASPEMLSGENYDGCKIDIWASGIVLFAMLCGYLPFDHKDNDILFRKILRCKISYPKNLSSEAKDLIKKILVPNPSKRITIPEIKKHPFYLKGKEIFDNNFTIYQETENNYSISSDEIYFDSGNNNKIKNFFSFDNKNKSQVYFMDFPGIFEQKLFVNNLRHKSFEKIEFPSFNINKFFSQKKEKSQKDKKINNKDIKKERPYLKKKAEENRHYLNFSNSMNHFTNDIVELCEKIIKIYKIEQKNKIKDKNDKQKSLKNKMKIDQNKTDFNNNKQIHLFSIGNDITFTNTNESKENKTKSKKSNNKDYNIVHPSQVSHIEINDNNNQLLRQKIGNQNIDIKNKHKLMAKTIKVKTKMISPFKLMFNNLFVKYKNVTKTNKLPKNSRFRKVSIKKKSTSLSNPKTNRLKNILNIINQQTSIKPNINIINKQNIINHFTTNITNLTKRDYYSNIIINNYKHSEENKYSSNLKSKNKGINNTIEKKEEKNIIKEYLKNFKVGSKENINMKNKDKTLKLKKDIKKEITREIIINKNNNKKYIKNKNSTNMTSSLGTFNENKNYGNLTIREKKPLNKLNDFKIKLITNTFNKNQSKYRKQKPKIKSFNLINAIKLVKKGKQNSFSKSKDELTSEYSIGNPRNIETTFRFEKGNKYSNLFANSNNNLENSQNIFYGDKNMDKIHKTKLNKFSNFLIDNNMFNYTDRKGNFNYILKNSENVKRNNLGKKQNINNNLQNVNFQHILKTDILSNKDNIMIINDQHSIQTQRNKPSKLSISQYNKNLNYLNSNGNKDNIIRNKIKKLSNNLEQNNIGNIKTNPLLAFYMNKINKKNSNNLRNKNNFPNFNLEIKPLNLNPNNLFNKTSDDIKINADMQKQKLLNKIQKMDNLHNTYFKIIEKNEDSNINYQNNSNVNTININKYIDSNRFKRKKINLNTNMINNNVMYINDLDKYKTNPKITSIKKKINRNSNSKNKNLLDNYFKNKFIANNNNSVEVKNNDNINHNNQKILTEIKKNSKIYNKNINNKSISINNIKNDLNLLNLKNFQYNTLNTELNFNSDENNTKSNPFVKTKKVILLRTFNVNNKRRIILKNENKIK